MQEIATKPQWGKWIGGSALLALAILAGGASLVINVIFGTQNSVMAGIVYGMADAGKILLLICCSWIGWTWRERTILVVCVILSVYCATRYWLDTQGQVMMARQGQAQAWQGAQADLKRIRSDLDRITETGDAAALTAQADVAAEKARLEEKTGKGPKYEMAIAHKAELRGRAGQARRRDILINDLKTARATAKTSGGPTELSGLSSTVALTGTNAETAERINHLIVTVLCITMAEMLTWLAIPGTGLLKQTRKPNRRPHKRSPEAAVESCKPKAKQQRGTKAYYWARLQKEHPILASAVSRGEMSVTAASINAGLRKPRAKAIKAPQVVDGTPEAVARYLEEIRATSRKKTKVAA